MSQSESVYGYVPNPLLARLNNLFWEYRLGISTRGIVNVDHPDSYHYATMFYSTIRKILDFMQLQPADVLVDIGSGKGRVLCCAALHPIRKVVGVDLSEEFCKHARINADNMRGRRSPIEIHNRVAQEFDYAQGTAFTLFNPFGASTLDAVLTKIRHDTIASGRPVRFAYANPVHESIFRNHQWLEKYASWDREQKQMEHSVIFYCSR